jgi:dihydrofolate reductase
MRNVIYGAACSLDGFIAASDGSVDWLHWSDDVTRIMREFWSGTDTLLMGRKTWQVASGSAPGGGAGDEMAGMQSYVFSRTLARIDHPGVTLVKEDAGDFVRALKKKPGKNIIILGGGELGQSLFEADVIDEVGLNIHPVLLGTGVPIFLDTRQRIKLELTRCQQLHGGCVLIDYRVKHARRGRHRDAPGDAAKQLASR